jgi:hypothetical protein
MSLRVPPALRPQRTPTGLHRTPFQKTKIPNRWFRILHFCFPKLFKNSKFRMIFLALIRVMNYYAHVAFKKSIEK